jgi:hypothetical protein
MLTMVMSKTHFTQRPPDRKTMYSRAWGLSQCPPGYGTKSSHNKKLESLKNSTKKQKTGDEIPYLVGALNDAMRRFPNGRGRRM